MPKSQIFVRFEVMPVLDHAGRDQATHISARNPRLSGRPWSCRKLILPAPRIGG
jgi:hypothetical protein